MDLRKEIKLSDLFKRKPKAPAAEQAPPAEAKEEKPKKHKQPRKPLFERKPKAERAPRPKRSSPSLARGKKFFRDHKLPKQGVRLGIASNRIGVRTFDVPGVEDEKQLHNAVRFRAQEALPIPLDEAVLDYHVLSESVDEDGVRTRRVLLVVAYRDLVDRYVAACRKAGLRIAGVDLEAFAVLRALGGASSQGNAAVVVASVGHDRTTLAVANGNVCEFTRVIEWGGHNLNVAIARALDSAPSEVEPIKRSLSLLVPAESWEALG